MDEVLRINQPNVVGEEFEGEVVAVHLVTGTYFSLPGSAGTIWQRLAAGATAGQVHQYVKEQFDCSSERSVDEAVSRFLDELRALDLITSDPWPAGMAPAPSATVNLTDRRPFQEPAIEAFDDLQDILLLDPIHDVDEAGWPTAAPLPPGRPE